MWMRKLDFLKKMQWKILQGGYQISSDTMLGNMASMDIERKAWKTIVLMIVEMIQEWKR
jgi:hypothetical protein